MGKIFTPEKFFTGLLINNSQPYYNMNKNSNESIDVAEEDDSTIANVNQRPNGVPENWIVNPHNNPDIEYVKTSKRPLIRENWISPEALEKICPGCTHSRMTNAYYIKNKSEQIHTQ